MKYTYEIEQDEFASNPRSEFDNMSTFYALRNSRYLTGGKNDIEFEYREDLENVIKALRKAGSIVVECNNYYNGIQYAVVHREQLKKEYLDFGYSMRKALYYARQCAKGEFETFKAWADGEVYGYVVKDEDGEVVDSCWGYYGDDGEKEARREAESYIAWKIEDDQKQERLLNVCMAI